MPVLRDRPAVTSGIALIIPIAPILLDPGSWVDGPLPVYTAGTAADEIDARATYFHAAAARLLYGGMQYRGRPTTRTHRTVATQWRDLTIDAAEVLQVSDATALAIVHLTCPEAAPTALTELDRSHADTTAIDELLAVAVSPAARHRVVHRRLRRVTYLPRPSSDPARESWCLAAGVDRDGKRYEETPEADRGDLFRLSDSWSCWAMRDALGFVELTTEDPFLPIARKLAFSAYLDVLLLLEIRESELLDLNDRTSSIDSDRIRSADASRIDSLMYDFGAKVWRLNPTHHAVALRMLDEVSRQRRLTEQVEFLMIDAAEIARRANRRTEIQTASTLGIIAVFGFPISVALTVGDMVTDTWRALWLAIAIAAVSSALLLGIPAMRELLGDLFRPR